MGCYPEFLQKVILVPIILEIYLICFRKSTKKGCPINEAALYKTFVFNPSYYFGFLSIINISCNKLILANKSANSSFVSAWQLFCP